MISARESVVELTGLLHHQLLLGVVEPVDLKVEVPIEGPTLLRLRRLLLLLLKRDGGGLVVTTHGHNTLNSNPAATH